jgi:hypothetical protein
LFLREKPDKMLGFLHITDPVCLPVPINPKLNCLVLYLKRHRQVLKVFVSRELGYLENLPVST